MRIPAILNTRFMRNAGAISAGAAAVQVVAFISSLVLTRLYGPDDFGILAIFLSIVTFAGAVSSLHYEMAIALPKEVEKGAALTILALALSVLFLLLSIGVLAPAPFGLNLLLKIGYLELRQYWWLLPITIFGMALQQVLALWNSRQQRFTVVAQNSVFQSLSQNAIQIALGFFKVGAFGLLVGIAASRWIAGSILLIRRWRDDASLIKTALNNICSAAVQFRSFPLVGLWGALLHVTLFQVPALILADMFGAKLAGWYLLQERVTTVPLTVVAQGIASVFYVSASRLALEDPTELKRSYFKILKNLSILGSIPALVLLLFGPWLFKTIFGAEWEAAGQYARIFAIPTFLRFVAGPLFRCLTILNKQGWILICDGIGLMVMIGGAKLFESIDRPEQWVAGSIALGIALAYSGLLAASTLAVVSHERRRAMGHQL